MNFTIINRLRIRHNNSNTDSAPIKMITEGRGGERFFQAVGAPIQAGESAFFQWGSDETIILIIIGDSKAQPSYD